MLFRSFLVVIAVETHLRQAFDLVVIAIFLIGQYLADGVFRRIDRERRIAANRIRNLTHGRFEIVERDGTIYQTDALCFLGLNTARGEHDFAGQCRADQMYQLVQQFHFHGLRFRA